MIFPGLPNRFLIPDRMYDVHTWPGIRQSVAFAFEDVLVAHRMEIREAAGEFDFFAVYGNGAVG